MNPEIKKRIEEAIQSDVIVVFMKGTPDFPQCGFSAATVECLEQTGAKFTAINVLDDWDIREGIKEFTNWPTIPQVYIKGEFVGGCDIIRQMYASGDLQKKISEASAA